MPSAHGVHDWLRTGLRPHPARASLDGLPTTATVFSEAGYRCGHVGKWHLGHAQYPAPGFTDWGPAHQRDGGPYVNPPVWIDGREANPNGCLTTMINDHATSVLSSMLRGPDPFYLQVTTQHRTRPGAKIKHPREYLEPYDDCDFPSLPRQPLHPWFDRGDGELGRAASDPPSGLRGYAASLTAQVSADRDAFARPVSGAGQNSPVWTADPDTARYASQAQPIVTAG